MQRCGADLFCVIKCESGLCLKDSPLPVYFQLSSILVLLVPAAMEAHVRKSLGATDVCVLTDSLGNTVKWVSGTLSHLLNPYDLGLKTFSDKLVQNNQMPM